jgi:purine-binding chemotaxis protein CheW
MPTRQREQLSLLAFEVDGEAYGVDARRVQEIVRAVLPSRLPSAPRVITGIFNLRGQVVSLIDLRARFGVRTVAVTSAELFVVLCPLQPGSRMLAFRADSVRELRTVDSDCIVPLDQAAPRSSCAAGTALLPDGLLLLCDVERFLEEAEQLTLDAALRERSEQTAP